MKKICRVNTCEKCVQLTSEENSKVTEVVQGVFEELDTLNTSILKGFLKNKIAT